jgi:hypothetical protein
MSKMIVRNVYPPIPDRQFDWTAFWDGTEETQHAGWGATREEAIADLLQLDEDRSEVGRAYEVDDNIDIDVCMGCGRYYSAVPSLVDYWRKHFKPRDGEVMPQLCSRCMGREAPWQGANE